MGIQDSFSRLKEKLEFKSRGRKHKPDGTGFGTDGEGVDPAGSLPPPPYRVAGGSNVGGRQDRLMDRLPQPSRPESALNDQEGREADADEWKVGRRHSNPRQDVEVAVDGGPGREGDDTGMGEVERGHPTPPIPSILPRGETDGM